MKRHTDECLRYAHDEPVGADFDIDCDCDDPDTFPVDLTEFDVAAALTEAPQREFGGG